MTKETQTLDALRLPLWGSRLIEASAGTGKTWTITALYLRLVLGHGGEAAFNRPLQPAEILVMTFTRAATRELSDRIRARLLQAAACFRGEPTAEPADALLLELLAGYPEGPERSAAAWRLAMAAEGMDDAAVHTIDAWCQRMLREHAFDSGSLFDEELNANERAMLEQAGRDYWRQQLYPLPGAAWDVALAVWRDVHALVDDARPLLEQTLPEVVNQGVGPGSLGMLIAQLTRQRAQALAALKAGWAQRAGEIRQWLAAQLAQKSCVFDKRKLAERHTSAWLATLAAWAEGASTELPDLKTGATRLTPEGVMEALKPGAWVDLPPLFEAFGQLMRALAALEPLASALRLHAAACIAERVATLKAQAGSFGFADLLNRLDRALDEQALDDKTQGSAAVRLRERMVEQYPVALVDEFQDTSPVQSRIFDRLYRIADNDRASALLLIGDPKQSIYGFRGADILSYLTARQATEGRHYLLGTNHRSSQALVTAVNHVFGQAEARAGAGAFLFRAGAAPDGPDALDAPDGAAAPAAPDPAGAANPLPFAPVLAQGRSETLVAGSGPLPALTLVLEPRLLDGRSSQRQFAAGCAERIVTLLNDPQAGFSDPAKGFVRLRPADIAVLVRTGREADAVRHELRRRGVVSVYLSDKDSVFSSDEASDLLRWLQAVAAPRDMRLARAALASRSLGLSIAELLRLAGDEAAFDERSEQLRQLQVVWQTQGVLTMLRQSLHRLALPVRWLGATLAPGEVTGAADAADPLDNPPVGNPDGERRLTNFLHLAELLQAASAQIDGEQALIRWLASQIGGAAAAGDEQIVRLESDADLVKVVTVHKSKGLEYPLVFLPFACSFRPVVKARTPFVALADGQGRRALVLQPDAQQIAAADVERQREDLRLLYVALTRARHGLWVGFAALKQGNSADCTSWRSAIGHLLCGPDKLAAEALPDRLAEAVAGCAGIALQRATPAAAVACSALRPRGMSTPLCPPAPYTARFERHWTIGSFSGLVRDLVSPSAAVWNGVALRDDEALAPADESTPASRTEPAGAAVGAGTGLAVAPPWHRFARGALPGNFLHDQLEWLAGEGFALADAPALQAQLQRRCERAGWGRWADDVSVWMTALVQTRLPPVGAALQDLVTLLPEMEFWLPSDGLVASQVDALCRSHLLGGRARPALPERQLHGMLMGFADLVFEHDGRYWVLDHKSNHLGGQDADYSADALEAAMAAHRYDVQAALYLLALHRLLRARLGAAYDPARQLGGAVYFFLRGLHGPVAGCCHVAPPLALLDSLDQLLARPEAGAA
jgi:exodeoxyribonuclease V beta subunit